MKLAALPTDPLFAKAVRAISEKRLLKPGDAVIAGVSGGPDSVCLLHVLARLREPMRLTLLAVHVNHQLRGAEANADMAYVASLCAGLGVELKAFCADVAGAAAAGKVSAELAGRTERYRIFGRERGLLEKAMPAGSAAKIAVAHSKNDLAETVLLNLLRGAGTDGLSGMAMAGGLPGGGAGASCADVPCAEDADSVNCDGLLIRPLLDITRAEIEAYNELHGLCPRRDATNDDSSYTRNRVRNELIPFLRDRFNPDVVGALARLAQISGWDRDCLGKQAEQAFAACLVAGAGGHPLLPRAWADLPRGGGAPAAAPPPAPAAAPAAPAPPPLREARRIGAERRLYESALAGSPGACVALSLAGLRALHRAVASRVVRIAAAAVRGTAQDLHLAHAEKILALAESPAAGKRLNMPGGLEALKSYDIIIFHKIAPRPGGRMGDYVEMPPKQAPNALNTAKLIKSFRKKDFENIEEIANISYNSLVQYFDGDILDPRRCVFRGRRGGDVFFPRNAPCAKKLKDWLIDEKIPAAVRDGLTLLADGSEIAWVAGYGTSEKYRVTAGTETVLRVELANV